MGEKRKIDYDDPKYRTTPFQQMASSCTGAIITSVFGSFAMFYKNVFILSKIVLQSHRLM